MSFKVIKSIRLNSKLVYQDVQINASDVIGLNSSTTFDPNVYSAVTCLSSVLVGNVVRMSSGIAINAQADTVSNSFWVGICIEKPGDTCCTIRFPSLSSAVYSTLQLNTLYFLSDTSAGQITTTVPVANGAVIVPVGTAFTSQILSIVRDSSIIRRA